MTYIYETLPYISILGENLDVFFLAFFAAMSGLYGYLTWKKAKYPIIRAAFIGCCLAVFITFFREAFWLILCDANNNGFLIFSEWNPARYKEMYFYFRNIGISIVLSFYYIKLGKEGHVKIGRKTKSVAYAIMIFYTIGSLFLDFPDFRFPHSWTVVGEVGALVWHIISKTLFLILGAVPFYDLDR